MPTHDTDARRVKATETTLEIVECLYQSDGRRLHEVADELELANSTVHQHLNTLIADGYVVKEDGQYYVGLEFLHVASYARRRRKANRVSASVVRKAYEKTGEPMWFITEENGRGYHVYQYPQNRDSVIDTRPGKRIYLHANAAGKSILAHLDRERVDEIIHRWGMPAITENTITDKEELFDALERVRERGYAHNHEEHVLGYGGIAAPVTKQDGTVVGALATGAPMQHLEGELMQEVLPEKILEVVNEFELQIEFS
jgi:DNA-binding IclR family transcriptional regulator